MLSWPWHPTRRPRGAGAPPRETPAPQKCSPFPAREGGWGVRSDVDQETLQIRRLRVLRVAWRSGLSLEVARRVEFAHFLAATGRLHEGRA